MMDELGQPTENQRAAARAIEQVPKARLHQYATLLRNLPLLLRQHGLGQTLAYLQGRGTERADSPFFLLYGHLNLRIKDVLGEPSADALSAISRADSRRYLAAVEEAHAFARALREAAQEALASQNTKSPSE